MRPALAGMLCSALAGAWWLSRYLDTLLFGIKPFAVFTYAAVDFARAAARCVSIQPSL